MPPKNKTPGTKTEEMKKNTKRMTAPEKTVKVKFKRNGYITNMKVSIARIYESRGEITVLA